MENMLKSNLNRIESEQFDDFLPEKNSVKIEP